MGEWTVTSLLPSAKTASTCTRGIRSATPCITSAWVKTLDASAVTSSTVFSLTGALQGGCGDNGHRLGMVQLEPFLLRPQGHVGHP